MKRLSFAFLILFSSINLYAQEDSMGIIPYANPNTITGDGTGTPNNVSKWVTSTTQTNSSISDDGTNVTFTEPLVSTQPSLATSIPFINHTATWSTTGTYVDDLRNITDSGPSNIASLFVDYQISASSKFNVARTGTITNTGDINTAAASILKFGTRTILKMPANGQINFTNSGATAGLFFQVGASGTRPTVASGFGTSPVMNAGASDTAGSINVGTGGVATTGSINFTQTWLAAPFCITQDSTGFVATHATATTTVLTITASGAWAASSVIIWHCIAAN